MIREYSFRDLEKYLTKDKNVGKDVLEALSSLTDVAIIFTPFVFGPQFLPMLELLDTKDRIVKAGEILLSHIVKKKEVNYVERMEQIRAAYGLICYTAYFEVLKNNIPSNVIKKLKSENSKIQKKSKELESEEKMQMSINSSDISCNVFFVDHNNSFLEIKEHLKDEYVCVSQSIIKLIKESAIYNLEKKQEKEEYEKVEKIVLNLPEVAINVYEAQYIKLAEQFNDFAFFAQMKSFEGINKNNEKAMQYLINISNQIDVGLSNLNNIVNSITTNYNKISAQNIVDDLQNKYKDAINGSIINANEITSDVETLNLKFPKIVDGFIPQSYKCLLYQKKDIKLEDNPVWDKLTLQHDLDKFFIKYLYSPDSIDYPLIILGQPGSGKSLLTKVLSAQLMSASYTVVRIPLREVNAENDIEVLVEDQIKKVTGRPLTTQGYGGFASQFVEKPLTIILDGYDELLQAKGENFSGYLEKIRKFQQEQRGLGRPVRMIITSRITLIDKSRIPINSTILRLMEFDKKQRDAWITIWNKVNAEYFASKDIKPFSLPTEKPGKKNNIIELAGQPLLLLMLAIFDSEANELLRTDTIKRTELYDSLLRRFVRREQGRYVVGFEDMPLEEQDKIIDQEMRRLGIAAIGMYNRQEVVLTSRQLQNDIDLFKAWRSEKTTKNFSFKDAEAIFRGFFFMYHSMSQDSEIHHEKTDSAYEFLHNTFGEFLAADFILRNTIKEVINIHIDRNIKNERAEEKIINPDLIDFGWYFCLMFVPLYSRPVVIEMLQEHAPKALQRAISLNGYAIDFTQEHFKDNLKILVNNQLKMILCTRCTPKIMHEKIYFEKDMPLIGYLSTYSLNIIIIACSLCEEGYEFDENEYRQYENSILGIRNLEVASYLKKEDNRIEAEPWDRLTSLWKAWFSLSELMGLSVIIRAEKGKQNTILIKCNPKFEAMRYDKDVDILLCVSHTLADDFMTGLAGMYSQNLGEITKKNKKNLSKVLNDVNPDIYISYLISCLRREINEFNVAQSENKETFTIYQNINNSISSIIYSEKIYSVNINTMLHLFEILESCLIRNLVNLRLCRDLVGIIPNLPYNFSRSHKFNDLNLGMRLLHLIIKDVEFFLYKREHGLSLEYIYRYPSWATMIDVHTLKRPITMEVLGYGDYKSYNMVRTLQEVIFGTDKKYLHNGFYKNDIIDILLETNPELLSEIVLKSLKNKQFAEQVKNKDIKRVLRGCFEQIEIVGIGFVGIKTIINILAIAKYIEDYEYIHIICKYIRNELLEVNYELTSYIVSVYPDLLIMLIILQPEYIIDNLHKLLQKIDYGRNRRYFLNRNVLKYIKLLRLIYDELYFERSSTTKKFSGLRELEYFIKETLDVKLFDYNSITIDQISDLIWYAEKMRRQDIIRELKKYGILKSE